MSDANLTRDKDDSKSQPHPVMDRGVAIAGGVLIAVSIGLIWAALASSCAASAPGGSGSSGLGCSSGVVVFASGLVLLLIGAFLFAFWAEAGPSGKSGENGSHWWAKYLFTQPVTRAFLAVWTVVTYVVLLLIPLILVAFGKMTEANAVDLLKTIASIAGGPVGIVVGFYFSAPKEKASPATLTAPEAPSVSQTTLTSSQALTVSGTIPSTGTAPYAYQWLVQMNDQKYVATTQGQVNSGTGKTAGATVSCVIPAGTLKPGTYTFKLKVTDSADPAATETSDASPTVTAQ